MLKRKETILDRTFNIGLLLKGANAVLEIIGGIALFFLPPERMNQLIKLITRDELAEDPKSWLMNQLLLWGSTFSISTQHLAILYLLTHGIIKLLAIILLWKKKLWAYPLSVLMFVGFIAYQMYDFVQKPSIGLVLLTVLDLVMIILTVLEYFKMKKTIT
ncbi:MAG: DUF2127 domain-containing protein [Streptococcaceae bacterium]|jgi:uncharacterized membrane protein|nr:DUF2127 domain-containing protein [Streptococcaceae bacterium]